MEYLDLFPTDNKGSPWKKFSNIFLQADISSDSSGRTFAGVVDFPQEDTKVTAGDFEDSMLDQDIQVKEGFALRATLQMMVLQVPERLKGKNIVCKVDNQVLKTVWERKGTSHNLALNKIVKEIFGSYNLDNSIWTWNMWNQSSQDSY